MDQAALMRKRVLGEDVDTSRVGERKSLEDEKTEEFNLWCLFTYSHVRITQCMSVRIEG